MNRKQAGFTIIELLIATAIFAVIIMTISAAVIRFSKQYYHGVIVNATQDTARTVMDDLTRSIQFNSGDVVPVSNGYCIGSTKRYSLKLNQQITDSGTATHQGRHALIADSNASCASTGGINIGQNTLLPTGSNARELLGNRMRLARFDITETATSSKTYVVRLKIAYGDDDFLTCTDTSQACQDKIACKSSAGAEYCAVAQLTTVIKKRID
jgi:prepilin-type N-terminal cleavage/methylation domain-containing protein